MQNYNKELIILIITIMSTFKEQSLRIKTARAQADKAINSLKGILLGINLDGEVNEKEINEK